MEEDWPYNLPIFRRSFQLASPDGKISAEIRDAVEVSMSNPTIGLLVFSNGIKIEKCNPSFIWSDDSRYLAVPQYSKNWFYGIGKQRLLLVDILENILYQSGKLAYYIQPDKFCEGILIVTIEPARKARTITYEVDDIIKTFSKIELPDQYHRLE